MNDKQLDDALRSSAFSPLSSHVNISIQCRCNPLGPLGVHPGFGGASLGLRCQRHRETS